MKETLEGGRGPPQAVEPLETERVSSLQKYKFVIKAVTISCSYTMQQSTAEV